MTENHPLDPLQLGALASSTAPIQPSVAPRARRRFEWPGGRVPPGGAPREPRSAKFEPMGGNGKNAHSAIIHLRGASVAAGIASQFVLGGTGEAWAPGTVEHLTLRGNPGKATSLGIGIHHARPLLAEPKYLFLGAESANATGYRDELSLMGHIDVAFDVGASVSVPEGGVDILPRVGFQGGVMFTDTQLAIASFDGSTPYRARAIAPMFGFGVAVEARAFEWLSVVPRIDAVVTIAADENEISSGERYDAEWRLSLGADVMVWF